MFFFSSRRRHTRCLSDWSSDVCSSDLNHPVEGRDNDKPIRVDAPHCASECREQTGCGVLCAYQQHASPMARLRERQIEIRSEERRVGKEWKDKGGANT